MRKERVGSSGRLNRSDGGEFGRIEGLDFGFERLSTSFGPRNVLSKCIEDIEHSTITIFDLGITHVGVKRYFRRRNW